VVWGAVGGGAVGGGGGGERDFGPYAGRTATGLVRLQDYQGLDFLGRRARPCRFNWRPIVGRPPPPPMGRGMSASGLQRTASISARGRPRQKQLREGPPKTAHLAEASPSDIATPAEGGARRCLKAEKAATRVAF